MKKVLKKVVLGSLVIVVLLVGLFVVPYLANIVMPWDRADAIGTALRWGGLSELPENADVVTVNTRGSVFTREFIIEVNCEQREIEEWVSGSSGIRELKPDQEENGIIKYQVLGHEGPIGGTVTIDKERGKVIIDMSWS